MSKISIFAQAILKEFKPKYKAIGWVMEYEWEPDERGHVFYCHPKGVPKGSHNIRTVSMFTDRTTKTFAVEFTEVLLSVVLGPSCYVAYTPQGEIDAVFFDEETFNNYTNK